MMYYAYILFLVSTVDDCNALIINAFSVDVPPPSSPTTLASPSQSPTSITLSWEQPAGDVVDRYDIVYTYLGGCSDYTQPENMAAVNDGAAREYTLQNLQEFSNYTLTITAVNYAGQSIQTKLTATTQLAGRYSFMLNVLLHSLVSPFSSQWYCSVCDDVTSYLQQHHCPVGSC